MPVQYSKPEVETIEVEVIPPNRKGNAAHGQAFENEALPRLVALIMDNLFKLPGTKMRFGLNPFLDLVPVFGDGAAAVISALTLFVAARQRVPKVVLARMSMNILLNALIGVIPGVGEAFAFWFRPSMRNYKMLQKHMVEHPAVRPPSTRGDWLFVATLAGGVFVIFAVCIGAGAWLTWWMLHGLFSR